MLFSFLSVIFIVGGIATLYYCDVVGGDFFATGLIPVAIVYGYLMWPILKKYFE